MFLASTYAERLRSSTQSTLRRWSWRAGAAVPDELGIEARAADLVGFGIDLADQIEIDEAVVDRRDERVGAEHRAARKRIVAAGACRRRPRRRFRPAIELRVEIVVLGGIERLVDGDRELDLQPLDRARAVVEIASQSALARVEIDRGDLAPRRGERDGAVDGGGGLAGAALFVGENDEMRPAASHDASSRPS
jgi:hypothetical protein